MHILRIEFVNGLRIDFGYEDADLALATKANVDKAFDPGKPGRRIQLEDDHGHRATLLVDNIQAVVLTSLAEEVRGQVSVGVMMDGAASRARMDLGIMPPEPPMMNTPNLAGRQPVGVMEESNPLQRRRGGGFAE